MKSDQNLTIGVTMLDFKRGFIRALFLEDYEWITCINKFHIIVKGDPLKKLDVKRDLKLKEKLSDQIHPDTYKQRRDYFFAWLNAECCADGCDKYCDECNHGIKFKPVPFKGFDPDVKRFIDQYQRFWLKTEEEKALNDIRRLNGISRRFSNRKVGDDTIRVRGRQSGAGFGLPGQQAQFTSNSFEGQEKMFLRP
jgi:hypothetical protein